MIINLFDPDDVKMMRKVYCVKQFLKSFDFLRKVEITLTTTFLPISELR